MYSAKIIEVIKEEDSIDYRVEFTKDDIRIEKIYTFTLAQDINGLVDTVKHEVKRLNDLDKIYQELKKTEGQEITE